LSSILFNKFAIHLSKFITLSHASDFIWRQGLDLETRNLIFLPKSKDDYDFFRQSIYGGRTYPARKRYVSCEYPAIKAGLLSYDQVQDYVFNADVNSLYPTAMMGLYPVGDYRYVTEEVEGALGIYEVEFTAPYDLHHAILPRHNNKGLLTWSLEPGSGIYTSIDLENAKRFGYEIVTKRGIVWDQAEPLPLFERYVQRCYEWKKENKEHKGSQYAIAKLLMNTLYGKQLQRSDFTEVRMCDDMEQVDKFEGRFAISDWCLGDNWIILKGDVVDDQDFMDRMRRPTYLGAFILSYSRQIMLSFFQRLGALDEPVISYTDTDSMHIHSSYLPKIESCIGSDLGMLSNDTEGDGKIIREINIAPKVYCYTYINRDNEIREVMKCKGIPKKMLKDLDYEHETPKTMDYDNSFKRVLYRVSQSQKYRGLCPHGVYAEVRNVSFLKTHWAGRKESERDPNWTFPFGYEENHDLLDRILQTEEAGLNQELSDEDFDSLYSALDRTLGLDDDSDEDEEGGEVETLVVVG